MDLTIYPQPSCDTSKDTSSNNNNNNNSDSENEAVLIQPKKSKRVINSLTPTCEYIVFPSHYSMYDQLIVSPHMFLDHMPKHYDLTQFEVPFPALQID